MRFLLESNGFRQNQYFIQPLHGVENISSAYPIAEFFTKIGHDAHVLIHRDGDALLKDEKTWVLNRVLEKLPERSELFITPLSDIEHQFCRAGHIASVYGITLDEAEKIVESAISKIAAKLAAIFSSKRQNAKDRVLRKKEDVPGAQDLLGEKLPFEYAKGKLLFGQIVQDLNAASHNGNRLAITASDALLIPCLQTFAARAWANPAGQSSKL